MGNDCCTGKRDDESQFDKSLNGGIQGTPASLEAAEVSPGKDKLQKFMKRYKFERLIFNSKGGFIENYKCVAKGKPNSKYDSRNGPAANSNHKAANGNIVASKIKHLASIQINKEKLKKA